MSDTLPTVMTSAGLQPQPPSSLLAQLLAAVAAQVPDYTATLPGTLVENVSSTDVGAMVIIDQMRVEYVNSLTPYGANAFILAQLGNCYGIPQGQATNTSVYVVFTGPAGYVIAPGFLVSDGTYQYSVTGGGVIPSSGSTVPLFAIATQPGSWAIAAGSVTTLVTQPAPSISLTVTNPEAGTPGNGAETLDTYRLRVLQALSATAQGTPALLKSYLTAIPGVQANLVSVRLNSGQWEIIVGGNGDPYAIGFAIWQSIFDFSTITGSVMDVTGITNANPGVVTTGLNHGYSTGQIVTFSGIGGMTSLNSGRYAVVVLSDVTFSLQLAPPVAATLTANTSGGSLPTETVYVRLTYVSADGETTGSPEAAVAVTGSTGQVVVTSPVTQNGATGYNVYAANATGAEVLQNGGTPVSVGTNYTINSLTTGTAAVPASNTAGLNTTSLGTYTGGGEVLPNLRNVPVTINNYPDSYTVTFVEPPQQTVTIAVTWNTNLPGLVSGSAVAQAGAPALAAYVNGLPVGTPMNLFELQAVFQAAVAGVLPPQNLTRMLFSVTINGTIITPSSGTGIIAGDPESYFYASGTAITITQG